VLDETMVWACALEAKRFVYCAELTVRYLHPIRPGASLIASSRVIEPRRNKLFTASAELASSEQSILAAATGKYMPIRGEVSREQIADFVGDLSFLVKTENQQ
jgi:acyl-coenzyme A thioesterase PaaI-like protein